MDWVSSRRTAGISGLQKVAGKLQEKHILKVMTLHRSGLQAHHIQAMDCKNGQDLMQGAALMGHAEAGTDLIPALTQLHLG